jgi:hypothetical protein
MRGCAWELSARGMPRAPLVNGFTHGGVIQLTLKYISSLSEGQNPIP